jgi:GT2 family glycosyltransferase
MTQRLRAAEARIEFLESTQRGEEALANQVREALASANAAQQEITRLRGSMTVRGLLRMIASRALGRRQPDVNEVEHVAGVLASPGIFGDVQYQLWIEAFDTLDDLERQTLRSNLTKVNNPLMSVLMPVFNPPDGFLRQALDSVRGQLYKNWELCIADDCSTEPNVAATLREYEQLDERIHVVWRETNGHISASSNSALSIAQGEWACLLDHDDLLSENALAEIVLAVAQNPSAGIVYSDEDHVDADGVRGDPYFKPDFDPLLILGQNYLSHLSAFRTDLLRKVGGFRTGVEGSQDWDLVLRVMELLPPSGIHHLPRVLYHWRAHDESTSRSLSAKPYVIEASRKVVQEHLDRTRIAASARTLWGSSFNRIVREPAGDPLVSVIILPRTGHRFTRCVESLRTRSTYRRVEVLVIDDGGFRPPMRQYIRDHPDWVTVIENRADISDSAQRNLAVGHSAGDLLFFLHDDIEFLNDSSLEEMVGVLQHPGIGAVGAKLLYPDLSIQHAGIVLGIGGTTGNPHRLAYDRLSHGYLGRLKLENCPSAVSWACMGVRREAFEMVNGFSEEHFTGMFGDVDFCLRLREAGWRTAWTPHAELIHFESPDDGRGASGENGVRFDRDIRYLRERWSEVLEDDPAYNPNLSLAHETFPLAWPPRKRALTR